MKNTVLFIALSCLLAVSCKKEDVPKPETSPTIDYSSHPKASVYRRYLEDYRSQTAAPGAVMLVSKHSESLWIGATGTSNLEHGTAFGTETPFRIGSITKVFVSALVLKLVDEGVLRLDDKLANLSPEVAADIPQAEIITLRQILAHTSGIIDPPNQNLQYQTDIVNDAAAMRARTATQRIKKYVAGKSLLFEPGSGYSYSNAGYWILESVLEKATGKRLSDLMNSKVLIPLKLSSTYFDDGLHTEVARGYAVTTAGKARDVTTWDIAEGGGLAAGGMVSTAHDIQTFYTALFEGGFITPALLADMQKQQLSGCDGIDCAYGLGLEIWTLGSLTGYGHNGALIGIEANALYFPQTKTTIVLYKNLGGGSAKDFLEDLAR